MRKQLRQGRQALSAAYRDFAAHALVSRITALSNWHGANTVAGYWPTDGEIDPRPLLDTARKNGVRVCLPVLEGSNTLLFREWTAGTALGNNRFGIPEPPPGTPRVTLAELDIILMPLVGWSRDGGRLGMGGGFYDRSLAGNVNAIKIGLAFACQEVEDLPVAPWDIPLDYVLTEATLHHCHHKQLAPGQSH